jgi:hypothetical protein
MTSVELVSKFSSKCIISRCNAVLHVIEQGLYHTSFGILGVEAGEVVPDVGWVNLRPTLPCSFCLRRSPGPHTLLIKQKVIVGWVNLLPSLPCSLCLRQSCGPYTLLIIQNVTVGWVNLIPSLTHPLRRSRGPHNLHITQNITAG